MFFKWKKRANKGSIWIFQVSCCHLLFSYLKWHLQMGREIAACDMCVITRLTPITWLYWDMCHCSLRPATLILQQRLISFRVRHSSTCVFLIPAVITIFFPLFSYQILCVFNRNMSPWKAVGGLQLCKSSHSKLTKTCANTICHCYLDLTAITIAWYS